MLTCYNLKDMSEFLIKFLKKRYNTDMNAFEYSYALNEVFEKTNDNEYIQQFAGILNEKVRIIQIFNLLS